LSHASSAADTYILIAYLTNWAQWAATSAAAAGETGPGHNGQRASREAHFTDVAAAMIDGRRLDGTVDEH